MHWRVVCVGTQLWVFCHNLEHLEKNVINREQ